MKLKVKRRHIEEGERQNCYSCPIALAIRERHWALPRPYVGTDHVTVAGVRFGLPGNAMEFIDAFDWTPAPCEPFSFELR